MTSSNALLTSLKDLRRLQSDLAVAEDNVTYWQARYTSEGGAMPATNDALAAAQIRVAELLALIGGEPPPTPPTSIFDLDF